MSSKITQLEYDKIISLKHRYGLTNAVLAERFGVSERTIRVMLRADRTGTAPYRPDVPLTKTDTEQ